MPISKAKTKYIHALKLKKYRDEHQCFIAEGRKLISELLPFFHCQTLIRTNETFKQEKTATIDEIININSNEELKDLSTLTTPPSAIAIFKMPQKQVILDSLANDITLMLDNVQDPGNLGTIIRTANWFGIKRIICSRGCADIYNPKVVQATMGAIAHVDIVYSDLTTILNHCKSNNIAIYGTQLNGKNIYETSLTPGIIIMGNEGNGISEETAAYIDHALLIPHYQNEYVIDSLNVAIATAITCAEFRRRGI
ncbi:MAG: RNA methyltransferase [Bacteroidales bacterium]|nr:RNA methyltransferase [Bacteroidales bacterium]